MSIASQSPSSCCCSVGSVTALSESLDEIAFSKSLSGFLIRGPSPAQLRDHLFKMVAPGQPYAAHQQQPASPLRSGQGSPVLGVATAAVSPPGAAALRVGSFGNTNQTSLLNSTGPFSPPLTPSSLTFGMLPPGVVGSTGEVFGPSSPVRHVINARDPITGYAPLHHVTRPNAANRVELAAVLLSFGADPNGVTDGMKWTCLHRIASSCTTGCVEDIELIKLLKKYGGRLDMSDAQGRTPYDVASLRRAECGEELLDLLRVAVDATSTELFA